METDHLRELAMAMAYLTRVSLIVAAILAMPLSVTAQDGLENDAAWLFVVQGTVTAIDGARMGVAADPKVVAFSDRPARRAHILALGEFVSGAWGEGGDFRRDPPNASLVDETNGQIGIITMVAATVSDGTLEFAFVTIEGDLPEVGDRIALTIDVVHPTQY